MVPLERGGRRRLQASQVSVATQGPSQVMRSSPPPAGRHPRCRADPHHRDHKSRRPSANHTGPATRQPATFRLHRPTTSRQASFLTARPTHRHSTHPLSQSSAHRGISASRDTARAGAGPDPEARHPMARATRASGAWDHQFLGCQTSGTDDLGSNRVHDPLSMVKSWVGGRGRQRAAFMTASGQVRLAVDREAEQGHFGWTECRATRSISMRRADHRRHPGEPAGDG